MKIHLQPGHFRAGMKDSINLRSKYVLLVRADGKYSVYRHYGTK